MLKIDKIISMQMVDSNGNVILDLSKDSGKDEEYTDEISNYFSHPTCESCGKPLIKLNGKWMCENCGRK